MKDIKTKPTVKDIKALDKSLDVTRRAKNAFIHTKEQAEQTQRPEHDSYVAYAGDKVKESAETVGNEAVHIMGNKAVQKIKERRNTISDSQHAKAGLPSPNAPERRFPSRKANCLVQDWKNT